MKDWKATVRTWISIHAPVKGATYDAIMAGRFAQFQSTHP